MEFIYNLPYFLQARSLDDPIATTDITGVREIDWQILSDLDDPQDIIAACTANKSLTQICQQESFWRAKVEDFFGKRMVALNTRKKRNGEISYYKQYATLYSWYARHHGIGDVDSINFEDIINLMMTFPEDKDILLWLMQYDEYKSKVIEFLNNIDDEVLDNYGMRFSYPRMIPFLYDQGIINFKDDEEVLSIYLEYVSIEAPGIVNLFFESKIPDDVNLDFLASDAARSNNVYLLYKLYQKDESLINRSVVRQIWDHVRLLNSAMRTKNLDIIRFAVEVLEADPRDGDWRHVLYKSEVDKDFLEELYKLGFRPQINTLAYAIEENASEEVLDYLLSINAPTFDVNNTDLSMHMINPQTRAWLVKHQDKFPKLEL